VSGLIGISKSVGTGYMSPLGKLNSQTGKFYYLILETTYSKLSKTAFTFNHTLHEKLA